MSATDQRSEESFDTQVADLENGEQKINTEAEEGRDTVRLLFLLDAISFSPFLGKADVPPGHTE